MVGYVIIGLYHKNESEIINNWYQITPDDNTGLDSTGVTALAAMAALDAARSKCWPQIKLLDCVGRLLLR